MLKVDTPLISTVTQVYKQGKHLDYVTDLKLVTDV